MDRNPRQQGVKQMPTLTARLELSEFEVEFLALKDALCSGSMLVVLSESWGTPRCFGKYPQILWSMSVDHATIIRC